MSSIRVLFVDDEPSILVTLSAILEGKGFDVTTASSVPEALQHINSAKFEVLISDLNIGEPGDGFTVVSAMRRVQPEASTFIITGYPDFESALLAIRNQVDDYFTKPANVNLLVERISQRIATPNPRMRGIPLRHLDDVLQDNEQNIVDEWLQAVHQNPELAAIPLSDQQRIDHIPWVLKELIERVRRSSEDTSESGKAAAQVHGKLRLQQGYTIPQIVLEARILQAVVSATVQANLLGVDVSSLVPDLIEIGESLASLLEISIRAYHLDASGTTAVYVGQK